MTKDEGSEAYSHISIVGDFNYKNINWSNHSAPRTASDLETPESLFLDSINDCFLTQHVTQHTRARGTDEPSLLDLVITNDPGMIEYKLVLLYTGGLPCTPPVPNKVEKTAFLYFYGTTFLSMTYDF